MSISRRSFLGAAVAAASVGAPATARRAGAGGAAPRPAGAPIPSSRAPAPRTILMLGGTGFLGPKVVEAFLARGHTVTLFNRGRTNPHLFPQLEKLVGDRDADAGTGLSALRDRSWDAVVDTWAGHPRSVRDSARLLAPRVARYLYVSTIAVYGRYDRAPVTEDQPIAGATDIPEDWSVRLPYPARKRLAEIGVERELGERGTIIRPGSICGRDLDQQSDNQRYWAVRVDRGGEVLAPGMTPCSDEMALDVRWRLSGSGGTGPGRGESPRPRPRGV